MSIIELKKVAKKYGQNIVLKNYDLTVNQGEFLCITGKSGSGKSTLLNIIGLIESPDEGSVKICGEINPKINSCSGRNLLRYNIAYLFQNYGLIEEETVEKNILISARFVKSKTDSRTSMNQALEDVGLKGFERKKVFQLSGGEQQRVALARIMVKPSEIILADEPTGSLDPLNREIVLSILKKLHQQGKTIVVVTHDEAVSKCAERIKTLG